MQLETAKKDENHIYSTGETLDPKFMPRTNFFCKLTIPKTPSLPLVVKFSPLRKQKFTGNVVSGKIWRTLYSVQSLQFR